jgi:hypothetical protein
MLTGRRPENVLREALTAGGSVQGAALTATALFCGDAVITPAISILSAVEGLTLLNLAFGDMGVGELQPKLFSPCRARWRRDRAC